MKLTLKITNTYGPNDEVVKRETVEVADPPASRKSIENGDTAEGDDWVDDELYPLTGDDRDGEDAFYEIEVTGASDPEWIGFTYEWVG